MVTDEILVTGGLRREPRLQKMSYDPNDIERLAEVIEAGRF